MPSSEARNGQSSETSFLEASGLLRLKKLRKDILAADKATGSQKVLNVESSNIFVKNEDPSANSTPMEISEDVTTMTTTTSDFSSLETGRIPVERRFQNFLEKFLTEDLKEACSLSLAEFLRTISEEVFEESDTTETDGILRDFFVLNRFSFLKCLENANWHWNSLFPNEQIRSLFLEEIIPACHEPESKVLLARIAVKMFALAVLEEQNILSDDFLIFVSELCRLVDFPSIFMWIFIGLLACDEMLPYLKGGICQVPDHSTEKEIGSLYEENSRHLNTPSLLRFRPEPRELKFTPTSGIIPTVKRKKFRTISIKNPQARRNQSVALDVLSICCEFFSSPNFSKNAGVSSSSAKSGAVSTKLESMENSQIDENSPSSPPPEATGIPQESPASPDLPEMRTSKILDEKLPDRFHVEFKDSVMKMSLIPNASEDPKKVDGRPTYPTIKKALYALGGWHWLAICLIDTLKPEESDKAIWWPEFRSVAYFNRNVHIVNAFKKNPIWMGILEAASAYPDAFLYYSPLLRPIYISLFIHWETNMESPTSVRNSQAREQTLWLLRCLSKSKLIHEPYSYLTAILDNTAAHEISSILESLWKVIKTYLPNPHGLMYIPDLEQDFRARQMAETDCLLKIRAVIFSRLSSIGIIAKKFFTIARVPLEESRWYESTQSQETASAPAPLNTAHLEKVD